MKKEEKTELTRKRILAAAMKEFGENGYQGASLNRICDIGIPKGLLYHNFENRDALYLACLEQSFATFTGFLREDGLGFGLQHYMDTRLHFFNSHPWEARLFFEAILQPPLQLKDQVRALKKDFDALNSELYDRLLTRLTLRPGITRKEAKQYFSLMQDMVNCYLCSPSYQSVDFDEILAAHEDNRAKLMDYMLYGIAEREAGL